VSGSVGPVGGLPGPQGVTGPAGPLVLAQGSTTFAFNDGRLDVEATTVQIPIDEARVDESAVWFLAVQVVINEFFTGDLLTSLLVNVRRQGSGEGLIGSMDLVNGSNASFNGYAIRCPAGTPLIVAFSSDGPNLQDLTGGSFTLYWVRYGVPA
jgi:hypothetical protein